MKEYGKQNKKAVSRTQGNGYPYLYNLIIMLRYSNGKVDDVKMLWV